MSFVVDQKPFRCIPEAFAAQVAKNPDSVAAVYPGESLTYRELDARSTHLARLLQKRGITHESVVGIRAQGCELIVAMLGVLKAGGAYLPLDPAAPRERLEWMLKNAHSLLVLWQQFSGDSGAVPACGEICFLHSLEPEISLESDAQLPLEGSPDALAYVMYTSGSTGHPKGVAIPHAGVLGLVLNTNYIKFEPDDRVAQASNMAFDAATFEIWGALLNGAQLVGIDRETLISPEDLERNLQQNAITILFLTPALFNQVASHRPTAFRSLRTVIFGGEAANPRAVAAVLRHGPPKRLVNGYGPTECTTFAICHEVTRVEEGALTIPIGHPISGTEVLLLNAELQPVAAGEAGEIYLGGSRLARGYLHCEDLSQKYFIPHPFTPGARLYRTGDWARALPDGALDFIGRIDQQVKLCGFRIELGEVEAALGTHPKVAQQSVLILGETSEEKRLVAYLAAAGKDRPTKTEMTNFLRDRLPRYMIPSAFVWLERLPITPNGKLDTAALRAMDITTGQYEGALTEPQTPTERALAAIWEEVLHHTRVGRDDNFFELGGHSIMAALIFAKIRNRFGKSMPLGTLFQRPTLGALAAEIDQTKRTSTLVEIQFGSPKLPLFLVHGGEGGVFIYRELAEHFGRERTVYGIEAPWLGTCPDKHWTMQELAALYLQEIRTVQPDGPYHLGGYSQGGSIAFEMAQQLRSHGEEVASLLLLDGFNPHGARRLSWRERIAMNWGMIEGLGFCQKIQSLAHRTRGKLKGILALRLAALSTAGKPVTTRLRPGDFAIAQSELLGRYRPQAYTGPITLLLCEQLGEGFGFEYDLTYGWKDVAQGGLRVMRTPGSHGTMFEVPHVQALALQLTQALEGHP